MKKDKNICQSTIMAWTKRHNYNLIDITKEGEIK